MLILYVIYIIIMSFNVRLRDFVVAHLPIDKLGLPDPCEMEKSALNAQPTGYGTFDSSSVWQNPPPSDEWLHPSEDFYKMSMYEAANRQIIQHRWLFRPLSRFRATAGLVRARIAKFKVLQRMASKAAAGPSKAELKRALTAVRQDTLTAPGQDRVVGAPEVTVTDLWMLAPNPMVEGWFPVVKW